MNPSCVPAGPHMPPLGLMAQYPFEPGYVVFTMPCPKRIRVEAGGQTVADSVDALILFESDHIPIHYLPLEDIRMDLFEDGALRTTSPYKGEARHHSLRGGGAARADIPWRYETPAPGSPDLSAYGSFHWHHVDRWLEEDEEVLVHARDPFRRVDCPPTSRRVVVEHEGARLADSARAVLLLETRHPARPACPWRTWRRPGSGPPTPGRDAPTRARRATTTSAPRAGSCATPCGTTPSRCGRPGQCAASWPARGSTSTRSRSEATSIERLAFVGREEAPAHRRR